MRILGICVILILLILLPALGSDPERVVAIGDIHGAYAEFQVILRRAGLVDADNRWAGGSSILVQTGDVLDRGPRIRECLDLLMRLEGEAEKAQGKVIPLLGNHEAMNLMGDLRYVTSAEYQSFATAQSETLREQAYRDYLKFLEAHHGHQHSILADDPGGRQKWMDEHPPGFFEYRDAMGPSGEYGRWIRKHHALVQIGDGVFMHGGLNPKLSFRKIADLDGEIRSELSGFDSLRQSLAGNGILWRYMKLEEAIHFLVEEMNAIRARGHIQDPAAVEQMQKLLGFQSWMAVSPEGPLWYRGLALEQEGNLAGDLNAMMSRLKVRYIVAGHTVETKGEITVRFDKHVFLIDTGMLKEVYRGRASAFEIQNGKYTAYYDDGETKVLATSGDEDKNKPAAPQPGGRVNPR